jgi:hypothetical protein
VKELPAEDQAQLGEAAFDNNLPALALMLKLGFDVNARGGEGFTPVNHAALRGLVEGVRLLIRHGADVEIRNAYGGTALESCQWGSLNFGTPKATIPPAPRRFCRAEPCCPPPISAATPCRPC